MIDTVNYPKLGAKLSQERSPDSEWLNQSVNQNLRPALAREVRQALRAHLENFEAAIQADMKIKGCQGLFHDIACIEAWVTGLPDDVHELCEPLSPLTVERHDEVNRGMLSEDFPETSMQEDDSDDEFYSNYIYGTGPDDVSKMIPPDNPNKSLIPFQRPPMPKPKRCTYEIDKPIALQLFRQSKTITMDGGELPQDFIYTSLSYQDGLRLLAGAKKLVSKQGGTLHRGCAFNDLPHAGKWPAHLSAAQILRITIEKLEHLYPAADLKDAGIEQPGKPNDGPKSNQALLENGTSTPERQQEKSEEPAVAKIPTTKKQQKKPKLKHGRRPKAPMETPVPVEERKSKLSQREMDKIAEHVEEIQLIIAALLIDRKEVIQKTLYLALSGPGLTTEERILVSEINQALNEEKKLFKDKLRFAEDFAGGKLNTSQKAKKRAYVERMKNLPDAKQNLKTSCAEHTQGMPDTKTKGDKKGTLQNPACAVTKIPKNSRVANKKGLTGTSKKKVNQNRPDTKLPVKVIESAHMKKEEMKAARDNGHEELAERSRFTRERQGAMMLECFAKVLTHENWTGRNLLPDQDIKEILGTLNTEKFEVEYEIEESED